MGLVDQAKLDIEQITSNKNDWAVEITLTAPTLEVAVITGIHTKIGLGVDTDGTMIASKKSHASFSEKFLIDANYPYRNASGEVSMQGHKFEVKDSTGLVKKYVVMTCFPDETIGLLSFLLEDYE